MTIVCHSRRRKQCFQKLRKMICNMRALRRCIEEAKGDVSQCAAEVQFISYALNQTGGFAAERFRCGHFCDRLYYFSRRRYSSRDVEGVLFKDSLERIERDASALLICTVLNRNFYKLFPPFFRTLHIFSPKILRNFGKSSKFRDFEQFPSIP